VLDEAHKYLVNSDSARLTQSVSDVIRLQRHLATRVIIATQEPTVIPATILDLASIIICHRFSSPAWSTHLARHVSGGSESVSWYQQVMLLATGEALVFSPAAVTTADERGGVVLLGKDHLKLRVRPRLTLDGGASVMAVGRSLPALAASSAASPPLTSESHFPEEQEIRLKDTRMDPSIVDPNSTVADATLFAPLSTPATLGTGGTAPSVLELQSTIPDSRAVPARLEHLVEWLLRSGGAETPLNLNWAYAALCWVRKKEYVGMSQSQWRTQMLQEAVEAGLVELINMDVKEKDLKARGEKKMIRLLERGPFAYV
jgi:hypothetical protein